MTRSMQPDAEPRNIHDRLPPASAETWVEWGRNAADLADSVTAETDMAEAGRHCQRVLLKDVIERVDDHAPRIVRGGRIWRRASVSPKTVITTLGKVTCRRKKAKVRAQEAGQKTPPWA